MIGMSHVILHVGFCKAILRLPAQTTVAMHLVVTDRINRPQTDEIVHFSRSIGTDARITFDSSWGTYRIRLNVPKYQCSDVDYVQVLQDRDRDMKTQLSDGHAVNVVPAIVAGTLPISFSYAQPQVVVFGPGLKCGAPVTAPVPVDIVFDQEPDAFYASIYTPDFYKGPNSVTAAVRLTDSSGGYHYIRMPLEFTPASYGWPVVEQFNITYDVVDYAAQQPEDVLLCPKLYKTSSG